MKTLIISALSIVIFSSWSQAAFKLNCDRLLYRPPINLDFILDNLNVLELYQSRLLGLSHNQLISEDFFEPDGKGEIVGINGILPHEIYATAADFITGVHLQQNKNIHQTRVRNPMDFLNRLLEIYSHYGPIEKLIIAAHGKSGSLMLGGISFDSEWVSSHIGIFEQLPKDLFAPDAEVVLISCSCAQGFSDNPSKGTDSLKFIFSNLLKQGGTVTASTRYVNPDLSKIPKKFIPPADRLLRHTFGAVLGSIFSTIFWVQSDWNSKMHKKVEINISPQ